jgi:hypothetical protein
MNKYVIKITSGSEIIEPVYLWANSAIDADNRFQLSYPGLAVYSYTVSLVPIRNQICIPFPIRAFGPAQTTYATATTAEDGPLTIFESPSDYGFPEYSTMTAKLKFRGYNSGASHGFVRLVTDNAGTGTYTAVANTEVEVLTTSIAQYTSSTAITLSPGQNYLVQGRCGAFAQTTWIYGAWLIITFS